MILQSAQLAISMVFAFWRDAQGMHRQLDPWCQICFYGESGCQPLALRVQALTSMFAYPIRGHCELLHNQEARTALFEMYRRCSDSPHSM